MLPVSHDRGLVPESSPSRGTSLLHQSSCRCKSSDWFQQGMTVGKPAGAPVHASRTHGNQEKGKLEGTEKEEHTCAGVCREADFTADGTQCPRVRRMSTEEWTQRRHNSLSLASRMVQLLLMPSGRKVSPCETVRCNGVGGGVSSPCKADEHVCSCKSMFRYMCF